MNKGIKWIVCVGVILSMCACTTTTNSEITLKQGEQETYTGINVEAPEGATNVSYAYLKNEEANIAKTCFTLDETKACMLAKKTNETELSTGTNLNNLSITSPDIVEDLCVDGYFAVSFVEHGDGYIAWLDTDKGAIYNISIEDNATSELLVKIANMTCGAALENDGNLNMDVVVDLLDKIYASEPGTAGSSLKIEVSIEDVSNFIAVYGYEIDSDIISSAIDAWMASRDYDALELLDMAIETVAGRMGDDTNATTLLNSIKEEVNKLK